MRPAGQDTVIALILVGLVFAIHAISPNSQTYDSHWTIPTTLSILHRGDADLDEFLPMLEADDFYHIECVFPDGRRIRRVKRASDCAGGHFYHYYPLGVPLVAAPFVAAGEVVLQSAQPFLTVLADRYLRTPIHRRLLHGDILGASRLVELLIASFLIALSSGVLYLMSREWVGRNPALLLTLLYAFGTSAWSTGSRALWMHGVSMCLLVLAFWMLRLGLLGRSWAWSAAGALLLLAFWVRPTNIVPLVAVGLWILWKHRTQVLRFAYGALPVFMLFAGIHLSIYHSVIPSYSEVTRSQEAGLSWGSHVPVALAGNLISPSRGLFVFTPVLLFGFAGLWLWYQRSETRDWAILLAAVFVGHYVLISFYEDWFGGHGYGPRYFADLSPLLILSLAPIVARPWRLSWGVPFLLCAAISVFMHSQGAWCWPCMQWDSRPTEIRESEWRLWDWREPMFLRGFQPKYASSSTDSAKPARTGQSD